MQFFVHLSVLQQVIAKLIYKFADHSHQVIMIIFYFLDILSSNEPLICML